MWKILKQAYRKPLGLIRAIAPEILIALFLFVGGFMVGRIWPEPFGFYFLRISNLSKCLNRPVSGDSART